jgi:hypothetical protein
MLGATQSVDMISSLRNDYGQVEVVVLNVDLLPSIIDTIVIGDRMVSLPIQLEGLDDVAALDLHMNVDDGNGDAGQGGEKNTDESRDDQIS